MLIYTLPIVFSLLLFISHSKAGNRISILLFVLLWLLCGLRASTVGTDTPTYTFLFSGDRDLENYKNEFIFYYLVRLLQSLDLSAESIQFLMSSLCYIPLLLLFYKKSQNISLSVLLFLIVPNNYFIETFNIVRQSCSLGFILWAYCFFNEKKIIPAILFLIIAVGFHNSSLLCVPLIIISYFVRIRFGVALIISLVSFLVPIFLSSLFDFSSFFLQLSALNILGISKYSYFEGHLDDYSMTTLGLVIFMLPNLFMSLFSYKYLSETFNARLYLYGCVFLNLIAFIPDSYRIGYSFVALEMLIMPLFFPLARTKRNGYKAYKWLLNMYLFALLLYKIYMMFWGRGYQDWIPYNTFL